MVLASSLGSPHNIEWSGIHRLHGNCSKSTSPMLWFTWLRWVSSLVAYIKVSSFRQGIGNVHVVGGLFQNMTHNVRFCLLFVWEAQYNLTRSSLSFEITSWSMIMFCKLLMSTTSTKLYPVYLLAFSLMEKVKKTCILSQKLKYILDLLTLVTLDTHMRRDWLIFKISKWVSVQLTFCWRSNLGHTSKSLDETILLRFPPMSSAHMITCKMNYKSYGMI